MAALTLFNFPVVEKVKPIIKWTGGKYDEFPLFSKYIPTFKNYYEPFFGGGGVFFALQPTQQSFLNDKSSDLFRFYSHLKSAEFKSHLYQYADAWERAGKLSHAIILTLKKPFYEYVNDNVTPVVLHETIYTLVDELNLNEYQPLFANDFIVDQKQFLKGLKASLVDKCRRIKNICKKEERLFELNELAEHIETGVKSGLYLHLRSIMNKHALGNLALNKAQATANWYFVREFCYASMFRYNRKKEFNIPYGGIAYNSKNFRLKAKNIFKPAIQELFSRATFYNLDFADFLQSLSPRKDDFIFLDPPYDSEFSEYDQNAFTKDDQVRLRNVLVKAKAKWMLVIKETDFIRELYQQPGIYCIEFDKTYTYNVRGRNNRETRHLIIVNYLI